MIIKPHQLESAQAYNSDHDDCPICNGDKLDENFSHCEFCQCLIKDDTKKKVYCDGMVACEVCYDPIEDEEMRKLQETIDEVKAGHKPPEELYA